jgi:Uma2 family endonuclease
MGQPAEKLREATYADLEAIPPHKVAEIINGMLYAMPRPAPPHTNASSVLGSDLLGPFQRGRGGPGGWWIQDEPELHFPNATVKAGKDVVVPDLAGWRRARMAKLPTTTYFNVTPDWICEVLSPSIEVVDREEKMPIYAREGIRHAWLVDPISRTLEVYTLGDRHRWVAVGVHRDDALVRIAPFDAIELDLGGLWTEE